MEKKNNMETHWSSKEAKKAGQKFRREARSIFAEYQSDLQKKLEEVRLIIKPRPKIVPRKVWLWLSGIFVDMNNPNKALVFESPSDFLTRKHYEAVAKRDKISVDEAKAREEKSEIDYDAVPEKVEDLPDFEEGKDEELAE